MLTNREELVQRAPRGNSKLTSPQRRRPRLPRAAAVIGAGATMVATLGLTSMSADAASSMTIRHQVTQPGLLRHQVDVRLPMSQEDAAGYIWNGARVVVTCYGDDWFDDLLPDVPRPGYTGSQTYTGNPGPGQPGLTATPDGVHLRIVNLYEKGAALNEDILPTDDDEIYCTSRWIDGDGAVLNARSNVVSGKY
jgi:hypothetical protein